MRLTLSSILFMCSLPMATPIYYTFTGTVTSSPYEKFPAGQINSYVVLIDKDGPGYTVHHEYVYTYPQYYYAETISELPNFAGGTFWDKPFYGYEQVNNGVIKTSIYASNPYYLANPKSGDRTVYLNIQSESSIDDWFIGQSDFIGANWSGSGIYSSLVLTDISTSALSIPEPSPTILLIFGLLMLIAWKCRTRYSNNFYGHVFGSSRFMVCNTKRMNSL